MPNYNNEKLVALNIDRIRLAFTCDVYSSLLIHVSVRAVLINGLP